MSFSDDAPSSRRRRNASASRRAFVRGVSSGAACAALAPVLPALAQTAGGVVDPQLGHWGELVGLMTDAGKLGVSIPRASASISSAGGRSFLQVMPATVDLIDSIEATSPSNLAKPEDLEQLKMRSEMLLLKVNEAERSPRVLGPAGAEIGAAAQGLDYAEVKDDYVRLFETCKIRDSRRNELNWYVSKLLETKNHPRWVKVAKDACCPWYFVAIIHGMECSFNFRAHLHNGDSIERRTVQVPRGLPKEWNPPNDWESSAVDALRHDGFLDQSDWSLARTLYRWERYNGIRSRQYGINTPYLWSYSNHYTKGKFVRDNVWDPNAVSQQCGAAVMLRVLVDRGVVTLPQA
jgi:lysozyme family protein